MNIWGISTRKKVSRGCYDVIARSERSERRSNLLVNGRLLRREDHPSRNDIIFYGIPCPHLNARRNRPLPHRRRDVSGLQIWNPIGTFAGRYSHRRAEWFVLFSVDEFDLGVGDFDDCVECDPALDKKIGHELVTAVTLAYNLGMAAQSVFQVPPLNQRKRIPMKTIRAIAKHIAEKFDPDQIILFGSHAYGKPTAWSDVDLLVVMDIPDGGEMETSLKIMEALPKLMFHVDVIARSREVIERRKKLFDWFLIDITEKGKILYERSNR